MKQRAASIVFVNVSKVCDNVVRFLFNRVKEQPLEIYERGCTTRTNRATYARNWGGGGALIKKKIAQKS